MREFTYKSVWEKGRTREAFMVMVEVVMALVMVVTMMATVTVTRTAAHRRPVRLTVGR